ncbi:MAG: hypothetical protein GTO24_09955 [candidate division Zixibacteria bacterium]|nr:hypothetical protein [candidate division Zixibacteria bacterium]
MSRSRLLHKIGNPLIGSNRNGLKPTRALHNDIVRVDLFPRVTQHEQRDSVDAVDGSIKRWYVVYTKPRSEDVAREELEMKDLSVFLPKIRYVSFRGRRLTDRIQPLFPNYLFARFAIPDDYYSVKWAKGVKRIVGSGDMPIPLDDSVVIFLKGKADETGLIQPELDLKTGDQVRVRQGPLEGLLGIVQGVVGAKGRVRILMDILHAGAKLELPHSFIEKYG